MFRLTDTYYTKQVLDGTPPIVLGVRQEAPLFKQGEDIKLFFYLNYNGSYVDLEKHELQLMLKKLPRAQNVLWSAKLNAGLFKVEGIPGYFYMLLPSEISSYFLPGSYYIDIVLTEKVGTGEAVRDTKQVIRSFMLEIDLGASSPNPKLKGIMLVSADYHHESGIWTIVTHSTEQTEPAPQAAIQIHYPYVN